MMCSKRTIVKRIASEMCHWQILETLLLRRSAQNSPGCRVSACVTWIDGILTDEGASVCKCGPPSCRAIWKDWKVNSFAPGFRSDPTDMCWQAGKGAFVQRQWHKAASATTKRDGNNQHKSIFDLKNTRANRCHRRFAENKAVIACLQTEKWTHSTANVSASAL